jgi:hypothetical protein
MGGTKTTMADCYAAHCTATAQKMSDELQQGEDLQQQSAAIQLATERYRCNDASITPSSLSTVKVRR